MYELSQEQFEVRDERAQQVAQMNNDIHVRLFTVSELVAAVVGTHLATVLLFSLVLLSVQLVCARRPTAKRCGETMDSSLPVCESLLNNSERTTHTSLGHRTRRWPVRPDYHVN